MSSETRIVTVAKDIITFAKRDTKSLLLDRNGMPRGEQIIVDTLLPST